MKKYLILFFAFLFLSLSYLPNLYEASVTHLLPPNRSMLWGEHIYTYDFNVYLSKIKQGQEGRWTVVDKYDNQPNQKGVLLQMLYLLTGKATAFLNLPPVLAFHLLRTIASFLWIITLVYLSVFFLKKPAFYSLGVIFSLLAASFPIFYRFENQWWIGFYMSWWQEMDILKRISFLPHDTINYIFVGLFSILLYLDSARKDRRIFALLCVLLFISVFIHPAAAILFCFSWVIFHIIRFFWFYPVDKTCLKKLFLKSTVVFFVVLIPVLYIYLVTSIYPWKTLIDSEQKYPLPFNFKEYIFSLGPIFFTGLIGMALALVKKQTKLLSLISWILGAAVALFIFKFFLKQSQMRFIQTANHIPLTILTVYLIDCLFKKTKRLVIRIPIYLFIAGIVILGTAQTYFSIKSQNHFIHQRVVAVMPLVPYPPQVMYPLKDFYGGLVWLAQNTKQSEVVLTKVTAGNYIPAYSGNFVYLGHNSETPEFDQRTQKVYDFYTGLAAPEEIYDFLKKERISYVFYGPQEKEYNLKDIGKYQFLKPVYQTPMVTIFKVSK